MPGEFANGKLGKLAPRATNTAILAKMIAQKTGTDASIKRLYKNVTIKKALVMREAWLK